MNYKGYTARVEFDDEASIFHGEVIGTRDVITFEGESVKEILKAFHDSVDDYLAFCAERGEEPDKPFSGSFLLRINPDLHRKVYHSAASEGMSLNAWIARRLRAETADAKKPSKKSSHANP